jgi:hypothetical protein
MILIGAACVLMAPSALYFGYALWRSPYRIAWRDMGLALLWAVFAAAFLWFAAGILAH